MITALLAYKHLRGNMNIKQSKYLVAPKVAAIGCTWDLLEWPLFLKQLPKTSTINKMKFLSVEFTTKWPSNNCTSLLRYCSVWNLPCSLSSLPWLNNTRGKQLDRNAIQNYNHDRFLKVKFKMGLNLQRHLRIQNLKRDLYLSRLVKLPRFPMNHWDHLDNLSMSPVTHLYFRHATGSSPQHDRHQ